MSSSNVFVDIWNAGLSWVASAQIAQIILTFASVVVALVMIVRDRRLASLNAALFDNQTLPEWLELQDVINGAQARGTGVYLSREGSKYYTSNVTYEEAVEAAERKHILAFSWVPHAVAQEDKIRRANCGGRCVRTCKSPGCLCHRSIGRCK